MARFKLSTDILSPIQTDGTFSFGSIASTPEYDKDIESPINKYIEKDSDISSFYKRTMDQTDNVFEVIVNDIKRQSNINTEKEEKFKDSYKMLKQSMDKLFYKKTSSSSILSPISVDAEFENITDARDTDSNIKIDEVPQNVKVSKKSSTSRPKTCSQISSKGIERNKKESFDSGNREQKSVHHLKNIRPKLSANNIDAKLFDTNKPKTSKLTTSFTQISKSCEKKETASKESNKKGEVKGSKTAKAFPFKSQQKIAVSNIMPSIENKSLSIEKSIQIAVGMEMDNLRCFILDQNLSLNKELLKLQDMARKQTEVTGHLFSLVDELLEANMKLISKQK